MAPYWIGRHFEAIKKVTLWIISAHFQNVFTFEIGRKLHNL
jgi:hypothetical protein